MQWRLQIEGRGGVTAMNPVTGSDNFIVTLSPVWVNVWLVGSEGDRVLVVLVVVSWG